MEGKAVRHILGLSGGKDSTALAVLMREKHPEINMEYFFCDTHKELQETYDYLKRIEARLGIKINYLAAERGFDHWLAIHGGMLPSPTMRWCTNRMKIEPLEKFVGSDEAISYVGIRADEDREGYVSKKPNIKAVFPFKELGLVKSDIMRILEDSGIGLPKYYEWRSRSGCFFCFFQRKYEWVMLAQEHPELFEQAIKYEQDHSNGRTYTWVQGQTLQEIRDRKDEIIAEHNKAMAKKQQAAPAKNLAEALEEVLNDEDDELPCFACHL